MPASTCSSLSMHCLPFRSAFALYDEQDVVLVAGYMFALDNDFTNFMNAKEEDREARLFDDGC